MKKTLVIFTLPLLWGLSGCDGSLESVFNLSHDAKLALSQETLKADQQNIAHALGVCLKQRVMWVESSTDSVEDVAQRLHQSCLYPFMALRLSKLAYQDTPDLTQPPAKVLEDELAICALIVKRQRIMARYHDIPQVNPHLPKQEQDQDLEQEHPPKHADTNTPQRFTL